MGPFVAGGVGHQAYNVMIAKPFGRNPYSGGKTKNAYQLGEQTALKRMSKITGDAYRAADRYNTLVQRQRLEGNFIGNQRKEGGRNLPSTVQDHQQWSMKDYANDYIKDFEVAFKGEEKVVGGSQFNIFKRGRDWLKYRAPGAVTAVKYRQLLDKNLASNPENLIKAKTDFYTGFKSVADELHKRAFLERTENSKYLKEGKSIRDWSKEKIDPTFGRNTKYHLIRKMSGQSERNKRLVPWRVREKFLLSLLTIAIMSWVWEDFRQSDDNAKLDSLENLYQMPTTRTTPSTRKTF